MDKKEFLNFSKISGLGKLKFGLLHQNCTTSKCFLTYEIEYFQTYQNSGKFKNASKKVAELVYQDSVWKIAEITNIKSFIDSQTPIKVELNK